MRPIDARPQWREARHLSTLLEAPQEKWASAVPRVAYAAWHECLHGVFEPGEAGNAAIPMNRVSAELYASGIAAGLSGQRMK